MAQQWQAGPKVVRLEKLFDELVAAGITPSWFQQRPDGVIEATVPDGASRATFDATLAAHNPATYDAADAAAAQQATGDRDQARQAVANLTSTIDNWGALTAAQKDQAALANLRATRALIRLLVR
jgi:hydroxylamine reductase (hybrid-cluster protein)